MGPRDPRVGPPGEGRMKVLHHAAGILLAACVAAAPAGFAAYPDKPIRIIVPFSPGGTVDLVGRLTAQKLGEAFGQSVVVENRGGASAAIGTLAAVKSPPDGYTVLVGSTTSISIRPQLKPALPYDPSRDLVPLTLAAYVPHVLVVHPGVPAANVKELKAFAAASANPLLYGDGGLGTPNYMAGELLRTAMGIGVTHVSYKGGGEVQNAVMAGHVQIASIELSVASPLIARGAMRPIGLSAARRDAAMPALATIAEQGVPGYEITSWFGIFAPAGTPADVVARLSTTLASLLSDRGTRESLARIGLVAVGSSQQEFVAHIQRENAKWGKVIRDAGLDQKDIE